MSEPTEQPKDGGGLGPLRCHTPGPWEPAHLPDLGYWTVITAWTNLEDDGNGIGNRGEGIANVFGSGSCAANARLIAAAPDLMEACLEVVRLSNEDHLSGNSDIYGSVETCKAAIAKALGERHG